MNFVAAAATRSEAIVKNRQPECSGRNGAWAVEMTLAVYHAALSGKRVSFPLTVRTHPLAGEAHSHQFQGVTSFTRRAGL